MRSVKGIFPGAPGAGFAPGAFDFSFIIPDPLFPRFSAFPPGSPTLNFNLQTCNLQTFEHLTAPFE